MTSHLVAGRALPDAVAGHVALELCNTKALWGLPGEKEYLTDFVALGLWAREHELITAPELRSLRAESDACRRATLTQVRRLRATLYAVVTDPHQDASLHELAGFVSRAVARSSYVDEGSTVRLTVPAAPTMIADRAALAAHRLLEQHGRAAVGRCAGEACGWVFLDPSHRRRWCTMAVCGNRAKVRRFVERRATSARTSGRAPSPSSG